MSSLIYVYPLDLQADLASNHIHGEPHTLAPGVNRVIVPNHGAFYTKDLVVREAITGRVLEPIVDYVPVMYYQEPSERSGLEVMAAIVVTNGEVDPAVEVDMRLVGGMYTNITQPLIELIANLNLDDRTVRYGDLLGKPHAFHPAHHLHDIGDVYGFEYMVEAIDRLVLAVFHGDQAAFDEMRQYVNLNDNALHARIDSTNANLGSHVANTSNPHSVTKAQVGLGLVQNLSLSTQAQMSGSLQATSYVTPLALTYYFQTGNGLPITEHLVDVSNPHNTTKAQVGLGIVENFSISTQSEAEVGTVSNKYMTPLRTAQAINKQAGELLNAHTTNFANPHNVTKAQTGLGSVQNYGIATQAEAQVGSVNTKYMTPLRTKEAITEQAGTLLNAHTTNYSNPHQVTKAQVGLGNADNTSDANKPVSTAQQNALNTKVDKVSGYALSKNDFTDALLAKLNGIAAGAQVNVGTNLSVGASATDAAVYSSTGNGVNLPRASASSAGIISAAYIQKINSIAHGAQVNTVHSVNGKTGNVTVTTTDIGLPNVWNYGLATKAQAQAGTSHAAYMTPLRVKEAIEALAGSGSVILAEAWGYSLDRSSGLCWNWGVTPALESNQVIQCNFKKPYSSKPFFVNIGDMTYATTGGNSNSGSEVMISVLGKSITTHSFVALARRYTGSNYDAVSGAWLALGVASVSQALATARYSAISWNMAWNGAPGSTDPGYVGGSYIPPGGGGGGTIIP